jgi:hypothetical protein
LIIHTEGWRGLGSELASCSSLIRFALSFRTVRSIGAARTFCASRATKDQEPTKGRSGGTAMFWKFIDVVAAIAMAIAVLN